MSHEIYQEAIKTLAHSAHGAARLAAPDASARVVSPWCGDRIDVDVRVRGGRIAAVGYEVKGCLLCRAAAAIVGLRAAGCDAAEIDTASSSLAQFMSGGGDPPRWEEFLAFAPVRAHPGRHACVSLPLDALRAALENARG